MTTVTSYITDTTMRIYINDLLHVSLKLSALLGINSWIEGDNQDQYFIEYTLVGGVIQCEYNTEAKWVSVLQELNKLNP